MTTDDADTTPLSIRALDEYALAELLIVARAHGWDHVMHMVRNEQQRRMG